ncbi:acylphosphatase [Gracilibacillus dipsosauri]|uniref:Acylphosphatase n=1 Tax=Gracilibacillus dipsosauri TaxID=178340 RepID=A0A317L0Y1_9BACI|nr:acylphosphatase [Gracilibacillus dipsosauri]PWU68700.1 acylphosphatase [Gracilibacillus dipsosauri]
MRHIHAIVNGRVQGVGFRYFTQATAAEYQIVGWVKNLSNGSVEIKAKGDVGNIERFLQKIRQGPSMFAKVSSIDIEELPLEDHDYQRFEIKY